MGHSSTCQHEKMTKSTFFRNVDFGWPLASHGSLYSTRASRLSRMDYGPGQALEILWKGAGGGTISHPVRGCRPRRPEGRAEAINGVPSVHFKGVAEAPWHPGSHAVPAASRPETRRHPGICRQIGPLGQVLPHCLRIRRYWVGIDSRRCARHATTAAPDELRYGWAA
jgi:hypothetical protein